MQHISMFKRSNGVIMQCVIGGSQKEAFELDGFVDHVEKLVDLTELKKEAKKLGIKGYTKMSVKQLQDSLSGAQNDSDKR